MAKAAHDKASNIAVEDGEIVVDGPDGVAVSMTPRAAAETGKRLRSAAREARHTPADAPRTEDETGQMQA